LGVVAGSFNPPTIAHEELVYAAGFQVDEVLCVVPSVFPHKEFVGATLEQRVEMLELATAGNEAFVVSTLELDRGGVSYTVETLRTIAAEHPQAELFLLMGADSLCDLPTWREPEAVLELATMAVAERSGTRRADIEQRLAELGGRERVRFFDMPRVDISSSNVRRRVRDGRPIRYLVPDEVVSYIGAQGLYRAGVAA